MISKTLVITSIIFGTVLMDSNLIELCSKQYFDSFWTDYSTDWTEVTRISDTNESTHHSWKLLIEYTSQKNRVINNSYTLKEGSTPVSSLAQPEQCGIDIDIKHKGQKYTWNLKDIQIINDVTKGPELKYTQISWETRGEMGPKSTTNENTLSLNSPGIWLSGLMCRVSDKTIFVIVEEYNLRNASNRTQIVSQLKNERKPIEKKGGMGISIISTTELKFWLDSTGQTVIEFFGIDCQNITKTVDTIPTPDDKVSVTTQTYVIIGVLVVLCLIVLIIVIILIRRKKVIGNQSTHSSKASKASPVQKRADTK